jgi:hypothetical protein
MLKFARLLVPLVVASLFVQPAAAFAGGRLLLHHHHAYGYPAQFAAVGPQPYAAVAPQGFVTDLLGALIGQLAPRIPQLPINFPPNLGGGGAGLIVPEEVTTTLNKVEPKLTSGLEKIKKLAVDSKAVEEKVKKFPE